MGPGTCWINVSRLLTGTQAIGPLLLDTDVTRWDKTGVLQ